MRDAHHGFSVRDRLGGTLTLALAAPLLFASISRGTTVSFLPVTWGDAAVYQGPCGEVGMVDTSYGKQNLEIIVRALERAGGELQWLVISHYDRDHFANAVRIMRRFEPDWVLDRGGGASAKRTEGYRLYRRHLRGAGPPLHRTLDAGDSFTLCGNGDRAVEFEVKSAARQETLSLAGPPSATVKTENDKGVCLKVSYGDFDLATCGDIGGSDRGGQDDVESLVSPLIGDVEVAKVNHHGSRSSSNRVFVSTLDAEASVIVGARAQYDHPAPQVVKRWDAASDTYLTTGPDGARLDGTVVVRTDGEEIVTVQATHSHRFSRFALDERANPPEPPPVADDESGDPPIPLAIVGGAALALLARATGARLAGVSTTIQGPDSRP